ncbi:MAG: segregation and condensation protein A [Saprospiraceae bacterium]|jgi:segregation and condensation protein A
MGETFTIKLEHFQGPFDLLLFFIERDELDIHDIPIASITDDFLSYIKKMETLNIDLASEFVVVAATLCRIKAKMLLPRKNIDEEGQEIDPREELVNRLLEYKKFKSILHEMRELEEKRAQKYTRGNVINELQDIATRALVDVEMESVSLFKILKAFQRVMVRFENIQPRTIHEIANFQYDIDNQSPIIIGMLQANEGKKLGFENIFEKCENRIHAIVVFLAILELLNTQTILITQGNGSNNFWIELSQENQD